MQMWLKTTPDFSSKTITETTELAASLEIAGVKREIITEIYNVKEQKSLVDEIAHKVIEKLIYQIIIQ